MIADWGDIGTMVAPTADLLASIAAHGFVAVTKADPVEDFAVALDRASEWALPYAGQLITNIDGTTRDTINELVSQTLANPDLSLGDLKAAILDNFRDFSDYRAEMIARTELMDAYNAAALGSYADAGITMVEAVDGDGDPECAERDGQLFTVDEADAIEDHPNGTLDWVPALGDVPAEGKGSLVAQLADEVRRQDESSRATLHQTLRSVAKAMAATAERPPEPVVVQPTQVVVDTSQFAAALDRLAEALRSQPAPVVNVPAPVVQVAAAPPMRRVVVRDESGYITETRDEAI